MKDSNQRKQLSQHCKYTYLVLLIFAMLPLGIKAQSQTLKVLSYNILQGMRLDTTAGKSEFTNWLKSVDPDILALMEVQKFTQKSLEEMAMKYGHPYAVLLKEDGYPVALTSKYPIVNVSRITDNMDRGMILAQVNGLHIIVTHLSPFKYQTRQKEANLIISTVKSQNINDKWILMGDFNAVSPLDSSQYADGSLQQHTTKQDQKYRSHANLNHGKLDYSVIDSFLKAGFADAYKSKNSAFESSIPTVEFSNDGPNHRIDFIFLSKALNDKVTQAKIIKDAFTDTHSDHYPVLVTIQAPEQ